MSTADEILKLKQLLDSGAITEEEYNQMKKKLLESGDSPKPASSQPQQPVHQYTPSGSTYSTTNTYRPPVRRYFNAVPFRVVGWISFGFAALFVLINIILLASGLYLSSLYIVWETTVVPASVALVMGIILKVKDDSAPLMVLAIIFLVISFILSIVSTSLYFANIANEVSKYDDYYYYYY